MQGRRGVDPRRRMWGGRPSVEAFCMLEQTVWRRHWSWGRKEVRPRVTATDAGLGEGVLATPEVAGSVGVCAGRGSWLEGRCPWSRKSGCARELWSDAGATKTGPGAWEKPLVQGSRSWGSVSATGGVDDGRAWGRDERERARWASLSASVLALGRGSAIRESWGGRRPMTLERREGGMARTRQPVGLGLGDKERNCSTPLGAWGQRPRCDQQRWPSPGSEQTECRWPG